MKWNWHIPAKAQKIPFPFHYILSWLYVIRYQQKLCSLATKVKQSNLCVGYLYCQEPLLRGQLSWIQGVPWLEAPLYQVTQTQLWHPNS